MNDPIRFVDDASAPEALRDALRGAPRAHGISEETRTRLGARVARLTAVPVSVATLLGVKSAAAIGIGLGVVSASVSVGLFGYLERRSEPKLESPASAEEAGTPVTRPARAAAADAERPSAPVEELDPAPDLPSRSAPPSSPAPLPSAGGLAEESALLESARRALSGTPEQALARAREHARRFPRGQLAAERTLLEIDALYRLGRRAEARSLAERRLAQGGDDLYTARVRRLLDKIDGAR